MSKKVDQVFPTSLSEIAFILVFLLMLLLGLIVVKERQEKEALKALLAETFQVRAPEYAARAMQEASAELTEALRQGGHPDPTDVITQLRETSTARAERDELRHKLQALTEKLSALTELRESVAQAGGGVNNAALRAEVEAALMLQAEVKKMVQQFAQAAPVPAEAIDTDDAVAHIRNAIVATHELHRQSQELFQRPIRAGDEPSAIREYVSAAKSLQQVSTAQGSHIVLKKENADLRGQLAFVSKQLNARGGVDHTPCWVDENGKLEYLFSVETQPSGFVVTKAWPPHREQDANSVTGIAGALTTVAMPRAAFAAKMQPILNWSKKQNPECRHFVYLSTTISDGDARDGARKQVEAFFYKYER